MDSTMSVSYEDLVKRMHEKSKELDMHIVKLKRVNDDLRSRSACVLDTLKDLVGTVAVHSPKSCSVCYSRPRNCCVIPCGHVYCESCANRALSRGRCFACRAAIEQKIKIYL